VTLGDHFDYLIEPLGSHHNRAVFSCGIESLDVYFQRQAGQDARKRVAAPFVLLDKSSGMVAGYYTLSQTGINMVELPTEITKKLPKYPVVPATLLGRLAVHKNYQGKGLGEILLMDALGDFIKQLHFEERAVMLTFTLIVFSLTQTHNIYLSDQLIYLHFVQVNHLQIGFIAVSSLLFIQTCAVYDLKGLIRR